MTAGLIVGFPVDLRYGWDVNNPTHAIEHASDGST